MDDDASWVGPSFDPLWNGDAALLSTLWQLQLFFAKPLEILCKGPAAVKLAHLPVGVVSVRGSNRVEDEALFSVFCLALFNDSFHPGALFKDDEERVKGIKRG